MDPTRPASADPRKLLAAIDRTAAAVAGLTAGAPGWRARALAVL